MGPMGNGDTGAMEYRGIGFMGNETHRGKGVQGVWGHMANKTHRGYGYSRYGYRDMGYRGYGANGQ